jgi:hypothetical protein
LFELSTEADSPHGLLFPYHADDVIVAVGKRAIEPPLMASHSLLQLAPVREPLLHSRPRVSEIDRVLDGVHTPPKDVVYRLAQLLRNTRVRMDAKSHAPL